MYLSKKTSMTRKVKLVISFIIAGLLFTFFSFTIQGRAEEKDIFKTIYKGITYSYVAMSDYKDSVEIVGVAVPEGTTVLEVPETLDGKNVISLDLSEYDSVWPEQRETNSPIKKLVLSKNIRPLKEGGGGKIKLGYQSALSMLENIVVDKNNKYLKSVDGVLYSADMSEMIQYPIYKRAAEYDMPDSVEKAYSICNKYVKSVSFSRNQEYNITYGCYDCDNLEYIYLPDNITEVNNFDGCAKLRKIRWSNNIKIIREDAFKNCISLNKLNLPNKVRKIEAEAFRWCGLKKVTLPESVYLVGWKAFGDVPGEKIKRASYLFSTKNKKIKKYYPDKTQSYDRYVAVATLTKNKKSTYYPYWMVGGLKLSKKTVQLGVGKTEKLALTPELYDGDTLVPNDKKGWKIKHDILRYSSSNTKVAKVTSQGKIKGVRRGSATITVRMKPSDVKCKVKIIVK